MSFARRLQHERTAKGWSQEQLAAASGVSATQIARIENQRVEASEAAKERLLAALQSAPAAPADGAAVLPRAATEPGQADTSPAAAPQPLALHLPAAMQAQLEAAAVAHGRSLHGEILARLADALQAATATATASNMVNAASASASASASAAPAQPAQAITWAPADVERLAQLLAQRLGSTPHSAA